MKAVYIAALLAAAAYAAPMPVLKRVDLSIRDGKLFVRDAEADAAPSIAARDEASVDAVSNQLYGFWAVAVPPS
ncbi:hypothetical protein MBLNU13_g08856t1 [Cladosporium sp. NU13]